jgi:signal transduction histidine kinase
LFKSLKTQVLLVLALLIILLVTQAILSRESQSTFVSSLDLTQQVVTKVNLVRELERDVLDLQRNVLIFKETASQSVVTRFGRIMLKIEENIAKLRTINVDEDAALYNDYINRMESHLNDYKDNFATVVDGRSRRQSVFEQGLLVDLNTIVLELEQYTSSSFANIEMARDISKTQYHLTQAQNAAFRYLLTPGQEQVSDFSAQMSSARTIIVAIFTDDALKSPLLNQIDRVQSDLVQLTQITRGYLFLVNVVMAGSANEFLFLTRELNQLVAEKLLTTNNQVKRNIDFERQRNALFSVASIVLALAIALFFGYRVMLPVDSITEVFRKLALGENIPALPGKNRQDEIGQLAKAADVFHAKNQQTKELLLQSQELNNRQEILNQELAQSKIKAEQATASKSMFLANMSHEIRTPMNGIIGLLDVALQGELTPTLRDQLSKVSYSTQILMSLINDILDFSKIEAGKLHIEEILFSPKSLSESLLANISTRAQEKNLNIHFHINPSLPVNLIGDPLRISQVLLNLSTNAIKFTRNGAVDIKIDYQANADQVDQQLENATDISLLMTVTDSGIGMSQQQLSTIFDSFTQADGTTSRKFGGTGLGLTIVKQLVELMNGEVHASSTQNVGSKFEVLVKVKAQDFEDTVLQFPEKLSGQILYFSDQQTPQLARDYLDKIGIPWQQNRTIVLQQICTKLQPDDIVLIDVDDLKQHSLMLDCITKIKQADGRFGFITDTQPNNLANLLEKKWQTRALSHPFSPEQFMHFINIIGRTSSAPLQDNDIQTKQFYEGHVLLVEDNSINQAVASQMLGSMGLTYDIAEDGQQAVTKVTNSPHYDLILMDVQMPVMDGYEATKALREKGFASLVICGLSANAMQDDYQKAFDAGMTDYITKPIKFLQLSELLGKYLTVKS